LAFRAYAPTGENDTQQKGTHHDERLKIAIRGAGEMASGIAHRLYLVDMRRIVMTEIPKPLSVRRTVSFSEAVYEGEASVEGVRGVLANRTDEIHSIWKENMVAVIIDPVGNSAGMLKPDILIDARMLKKQTSLAGNEAPFYNRYRTGFTAPINVSCRHRKQPGP
jgi:xanthine dehydrogenase accessory factor